MMNAQQFEIALGRLKVVGGACYGFLCPEDIRAVALRVAPQTEEKDLERLAEACREFHQVVTGEEKEAVLARVRAEREAEQAREKAEELDDEIPLGSIRWEDLEKTRKIQDENLALGHRVLGILLRNETDSAAQKLWQAVAAQDPQYKTILELRPDSNAEAVAQALQVKLEVLYKLEQEIIRAYYTHAEQAWRENR